MPGRGVDHGMARPGEASQGKAMQGEDRGKAMRGCAGHGEDQGWAGRGARLGTAVLGQARQGKARIEAGRGCAGRGEAGLGEGIIEKSNGYASFLLDFWGAIRDNNGREACSLHDSPPQQTRSYEENMHVYT